MDDFNDYEYGYGNGYGYDQEYQVLHAHYLLAGMFMDQIAFDERDYGCA